MISFMMSVVPPDRRTGPSSVCVTVRLPGSAELQTQRSLGQNQSCRGISEESVVGRLYCPGGDWSVSSGGPAGEAEDPADARAEARAGESFDARGQVKSEAAWELHCRATADSAVDDHPGFVPGIYLDGLGAGTAVMVAELCSVGVWERAEGDYRILDRDAVGRCQDLARQLSGEAARVHARAQLMPEMAEAMVVTPPCAACGAPATRIELVAPGQLPAQWSTGPAPCGTASYGTAGRASGT